MSMFDQIAAAAKAANQDVTAAIQEVIQAAVENQIDIGGEYTPHGKSAPTRPRRTVQVQKPHKRAAPKVNKPKPKPTPRKSTGKAQALTTDDLEAALRKTLTGEGTEGSSYVLTKDALNGMLTDNDTVVYVDALGNKHYLGGLQTRRTNLGQEIVGGTNEAPIVANSQGKIGGGNDYVTVNQAISEFMAADPMTIARWQDDLSAAGFMGFDSDGMPKQAFIRGAPDDFTVKAYADFLEYSLYRGGFRDPATTNEQVATGKDWRELLDERVAAVQDELAKQARGGGGGRGDGTGGGGIEMPDPLAVKALANSIGQLLMGRTLDDNELNDIVARVNAGAVASDAMNQDFDVEANITEWLKRGTGTSVETTAHDLANMYSTFTGLIGPMDSAAARGGQAQGVTVT